jgi:hypothetical protein
MPAERLEALLVEYECSGMNGRALSPVGGDKIFDLCELGATAAKDKEAGEETSGTD